MKKYLSLILLCFALAAQAQSLVSWSAPTIVSGLNGYESPHICISNSTPLFTYGDFMTGNFYISRYVSGSFTSPMQINPTGFTAVVNANGGFGVKSKGDTVFVTYIDGNSTHVYLQRSVDGGVSFSDTIRVDNIGNNIPQYATVAIMPGGNPIIAFAKLDSNFANPQYVVTKSYNGGISFSPDVNATGSLGADPCDCCPGNISFDNNKVAVIYRNSINDLRDMRAAISTDTGNTFSSLGVIDNNGWVNTNCPTNGGHGIIQGDTLISVFMNGLNGSTCYISTYNMITNQPGFEKPIFQTIGGGNQDVSRIAGSGDTLGVVWDQVISGSRYILFSYSTTGASGLGIYVDTISDVIANGFHTLPDIAYKDGKFYVVFNDYVAAELYYMEGTVNGVSGLDENAGEEIKVNVIAENSTLNIHSNKAINEPLLISIYNIQGKLIENIKLPALHLNQLINLEQKLNDGMYVVNVAAKDFTVSKKLVLLNR